MARKKRYNSNIKRLLKMIQTLQRIIIVICLLIAFQKCNAQSVHVRKASYGKGYRVCIVDQPWKADLSVHKVDYQWEAKMARLIWVHSKDK